MVESGPGSGSGFGFELDSPVTSVNAVCNYVPKCAQVYA